MTVDASVSMTEWREVVVLVEVRKLVPRSVVISVELIVLVVRASCSE